MPYIGEATLRVVPPRAYEHGAPRPVIIAVHGYGQPIDAMLRFAVAIAPDDAGVVVPEGPSEFYRRPRRGSRAGISHGWIGDSQNRDASDRRNAMIIERALDFAAERWVVDPERTWLVGYSQGVGVATHAFVTHRSRFAGLIGLAGGVTERFRPELRALAGKPVLWVTGAQDHAYANDYDDAVIRAWREAGAAIETEQLDTGHDLLPHADGLVGRWLAKRLRETGLGDGAPTR